MFEGEINGVWVKGFVRTDVVGSARKSGVFELLDGLMVSVEGPEEAFLIEDTYIIDGDISGMLSRGARFLLDEHNQDEDIPESDEHL